MIEPIINVLSSKINNLPWIERHGGLVRTARKINLVDGQPFEEYYPVSMSDTDKECWENGKHMDLAPNSKYKSVSYFDQNGIVKVSDSEYPDFKTFEANVSFVCWLNLKKLGEAHQSGYLYELDAIKTLSEKLQINKHHKLTCKIVGLHPKNEGIFQKYNYADRLDLFLYPYDYFSIQMLIKWEMDIKCFDLTLNDPIC